MPYGLIKATNYYNRIEAWRDWRMIYAQSCAIGMQMEADDLKPPLNSGWREIDKRIAKLRKAIKQRTDAINNMPRSFVD